MLKLTKTGIGLLTKQYSSVLLKCMLLNLGLLLGFISTSYAWFDVSNYKEITTATDCDNNIFCAGSWSSGRYYGLEGNNDILSLALKTRLEEKGISVSYGTSFTSEQLIEATRDIIFGTYIRVSGLASVATSGNASDLTQDATHRLVTDTEKSTWNAKQNALSTAQLNAVNSGITAAKVSTYDGYATTIAGKANKATTLSGYGITNAYTKTETDSAISQAISGFVTNDVQSLNYYYTKDEVKA